MIDVPATEVQSVIRPGKRQKAPRAGDPRGTEVSPAVMRSRLLSLGRCLGPAAVIVIVERRV